MDTGLTLRPMKHSAVLAGGDHTQICASQCSLFLCSVSKLGIGLVDTSQIRWNSLRGTVIENVSAISDSRSVSNVSGLDGSNRFADSDVASA
jgi:hypothetical protein